MKVLDHGFVILRNLAGPTRRMWNGLAADGDYRYSGEERNFDADDIDPAQCARMSFEQMDSDRTYEQDMKLNEYLLRNLHTSPFEMIQVWLEVKVPIFVDRQMVRHRTWRRNESSGRYVTLPAEWYIPEVVGGKAANKKQGQEDNLDEWKQMEFRTQLLNHCSRGYAEYLRAMAIGVAPEHARMFLSVNHYVHWIGNVDLANLFKFCALRAHSHAQIEAQKYADAIIQLLRPELPGLMRLFDEVVRR
ncbi:MAG TPA: FAD-dependent thymidylate synthase [Nitrospira sp.]|nr:FAD-dependent thymidylate synthase [Nitrospira sp.]